MSDQQNQGQSPAEQAATAQVQDHANQIVDLAQGLANDVVDAGEHAASIALGAVGKAIHALGDVVETLQEKLTGSQ